MSSIKGDADNTGQVLYVAAFSAGVVWGTLQVSMESDFFAHHNDGST